MNKQQGDDRHELLELMEKCGHMLYHRRGGKQGQGRILRLLAIEGVMTQTQLMGALDIQAGSLSEIVSKLEAKGFITKQKDEADRRKTVLALTDFGKERIRTVKQKRREEEHLMFDVLTEEQRGELKALLSLLFTHWQDTFGKELQPHKHPHHHGEGPDACSNT